MKRLRRIMKKIAHIMQRRKHAYKAANGIGSKFLNTAVSLALLVLAFVCVIGLGTTLWHFVNDIIVSREYFNNLYNSVGSNGLSTEQIEQIKVLDSAYKSSRDFDIMSFFYMFASTILIGLIIYFYNKINTIISEHNLLLKNNADLINEQKGIYIFNDISNRISMAQITLGIIETAFVQSIQPAQSANIALETKKITEHYIPRLRDNLRKADAELERMLSGENNFILPKRQIDYALEMYNNCKARVGRLYDKNSALIERETSMEFTQYIDNCISSLRSLRNSNTKN